MCERDRARGGLKEVCSCAERLWEGNLIGWEVRTEDETGCKGAENERKKALFSVRRYSEIVFSGCCFSHWEKNHVCVFPFLCEKTLRSREIPTLYLIPLYDRTCHLAGCRILCTCLRLKIQENVTCRAMVRNWWHTCLFWKGHGQKNTNNVQLNI